jgi:hypothetical protein
VQVTYLLTQVRRQGDWLGAPINLLVSWGTVAGGIIGRTVKELTAIPRAERVGVRCKGVAPFRAQLILKKDAVNEGFLADR